MREIKFRGLTKEGKWVYGSHVQDWDTHYIFNNQAGDTLHDCMVDVIPSTVGQFTGLKDKNGREIWEGNLVIFNGNPNAIHEVFYHENEARFKCGRTRYRNGQCGGYVPEVTSDRLEVIGDIRQNPELLEDK